MCERPAWKVWAPSAEGSQGRRANPGRGREDQTFHFGRKDREMFANEKECDTGLWITRKSLLLAINMMDGGLADARCPDENLRPFFRLQAGPCSF